MSDVFKWAGLGDTQIPYHNKRALSLTMKVLKWWKPDAIDFTGDIADCLEYSTFSDGTTDEFFAKLKKEKQFEEETLEDFKMRVSPLPFVVESQKETAKFFKDFRNQHKNADMHYSIGNHEQRITKYVDKKLPEYLEYITPENLWGVDNLGITWRPYELPPFERFGGIFVHHGDTSSSAGLAVKGDIEKYNISLMRGHDHRGGVVYNSFPIAGVTHVGIGAGHLCDIHAYGLQYTVNPTWELGFAVVRIVNGAVFPEFINIQETENGLTCVLDNKVFHG